MQSSKILLACTALILAGCVSTRTANLTTPEQVSQFLFTDGETELCKVMTPQYLNENRQVWGMLVQRQVMTESELQRAAQGTFSKGDPVCSLLVVKGHPKAPPFWCGDINTSVGSYGAHRQYVYRRCGNFSGTFYVYTDGSRITGWQN